jgi:hypothetical protein
MHIFRTVCCFSIVLGLFAFNFFQMLNCKASFNVVDFGNNLKNLSQKI